MTKKELQAALRQAGVTFRMKAPKAELQQLLGESQQAKKKTKVKVNGHAKGAKATLRAKFEKAGVVTSKQIDRIAVNLNVQRATVLTALSDLQNKKYAGPLGPLNIGKDGDAYRLVK